MTLERRYVSSTDVARHAGVSQAAVSRTFTPGASVSPAMREKVLAAARELGYRPNLLPQALQTNRTGLIAVAVGNLHNSFHAGVLQKLTESIQATGRQVLLTKVTSSYAIESMLDQIAGYRVDALISNLAVLSTPMAKRLAELRIPVVCFNSRIKTEWVSSVSSDNRSAGVAAAELLARSGEVFAFVDGVAESPSAHARRGGFQQGLERLGRNPPMIVSSDYSYESGQAAAEVLFSGKTRPDSVFCVNDHVAFGLIDVLRRKGLRCPEDVRVIGYDGVTLAGWDAYSLTTFDPNLDAMVELTLKLTLGETEEGRKGVLRTIPPLLIERRSTAAPA